MTEINPALLQQGIMLNASSAPKAVENPHNLVNITTAKEVGDIAKKRNRYNAIQNCNSGLLCPSSRVRKCDKTIFKSS